MSGTAIAPDRVELRVVAIGASCDDVDGHDQPALETASGRPSAEHDDALDR